MGYLSSSACWRGRVGGGEVLVTDEVQERRRLRAAAEAVSYVKSGMVVGLGAGGTAALAIRRIAELLREGALTGLVGIPCSCEVEALALELGVPVGDLNEHPRGGRHHRRRRRDRLWTST